MRKGIQVITSAHPEIFKVQSITSESRNMVLQDTNLNNLITSIFAGVASAVLYKLIAKKDFQTNYKFGMYAGLGSMIGQTTIKYGEPIIEYLNKLF